MRQVKMKNVMKMMIIMGIFLALATSTFALGISPAKKVIDYAPGTHEIKFSIFNDEGKSFRAAIELRGEIAEYVQIKESIVVMRSDEASKEITLIANLPEGFDEPGLRGMEIVVIEIPDEFNSETNVISALTSVAAELNIRVPFPGKYAIASIDIGSAEVGDEVRLAVMMQNYGKQPIFKARANIEIFGATYESIAKFETTEIGLNPQEQGKMIGIWKADVNPGVYHAKATIYYDDQKIEVEKDFSVGKAGLEISKIIPEEFKLGDVAIFDIFLQNNWNKQLTGVYSKVIIKDDKGTIYGTYNTETIDINPNTEEMVKAYWNTRDAVQGNYQLHLAVYIGETIIEKVEEFQVNINSISMLSTGQVTGTNTGLISRESILSMLVLIIIILNIGGFIYFRRRRTKK